MEIPAVVAARHCTSVDTNGKWACQIWLCENGDHGSQGLARQGEASVCDVKVKHVVKLIQVGYRLGASPYRVFSL